MILNANTSCYNTSWGAEEGESGGKLSGLKIPENPDVTPPMNIQMSEPMSICLDSCVRLSANIRGGIPPYRFSWTPTDGLSTPSDSVTKACPKVTTTYTTIVTDAGGCQISGTITVSVFPAPTKPVIYQQNDSLISTPASQYQWYRNGEPLPGENKRNIFISLDGRYSVQIIDSNGCSEWSNEIFLGAIEATIGLSCIDSIEYPPGFVLALPIELLSSHNLAEATITDYKIWLHFDKNILQPVYDQNVQYHDSGRIRYVKLIGIRRDDLPTGILRELPLKVMLGDTTCTTVSIDSMIWLDGNVKVIYQNHVCTVCVKVCREGGVRLFRSTGKLQLKQIHPNPFNTGALIEYELDGEEPICIEIYNIYGRKIATLVDEILKPGTYRTEFIAGDIPTGIYFLMLRTPTRSLHRRMIHIK